MTTPKIRQQERIVNAELARLMRERCGLNAQAEVIVDGRQPDVLVMRPDNSPVIIETEFLPARGVNDDALAKLGLKIGGQPTKVTFAVKLPRDLREVDQSYLGERVANAPLTWQEWHEDSTSGPPVGGRYDDLCEQIRRSTPRGDDVAFAVEELERSTAASGSLIMSNPVLLQRVAWVFDREPSAEVANMAALMVINAMVFNDRLARSSNSMPALPRRAERGRNLSIDLTDAWGEILLVGYWPVFRTAYDILEALPTSASHEFAVSCLESANRMLALRVFGRHDLAGHVFNRLVADRKFLAAFYTTIPAAVLLAGLSLDRKLWTEVDWSDIDSLRDFVVLDPACGTGTLLMAAYRQIAQNHRSTSSPASYAESEEALHQALIEDSIQGADVVDAAIHMTASTLAAMAPAVTFQRMNLHVLPLENDEVDGPRLGSLDWFESEQLRTMFSGAGEQVGALAGATSSILTRPKPNLVIANPPYRRHNSATGEGDYQTRVFGHKDISTERGLAKHLSSLLSDKPANQVAGLGSAFISLADHLLGDNGRLAFVLPATSIAGTSWAQIRHMLSNRYEVEYVVSTHTPHSDPMSYDTNIEEVLLVARKSSNEDVSGRGRFVNLWRQPTTENEAIALVGVIRRAPSQVHRVDGPPVGGTPLLLGNDQWGEIIDAPLASSPWAGGRWKNAVSGQYAYSLTRGELWSADGTSKIADLPIDTLEKIVEMSAYDLQIKGTSGAFEIYEGHDDAAQFPAIWHHSARRHRGVVNTPNARLSPKAGADYTRFWEQAGRLHLTRDIRYTSQRIHSAITYADVLGVRSWYTLRIKHEDADTCTRGGILLALWLNSTFGMLCHANHANRSQAGRGLGSRTMLSTLPTLDVRQLDDWQLDAAEEVFHEFREAQFEPFYKCAVDPNRIRLDERLVRDVLGLDDDAVKSITRVRSLLANEPSIHGSKEPALAS